MVEFAWYSRLPKLEDQVPHDDLPDEPEEELSLPENASETLADLFIYIEYTNAGGISSRRPITIKKESVSGGGVSLFAYCHKSRSIRQFRLDRISSVITKDGEIFEPATTFWTHIGYYIGGKTEHAPIIPDDRSAATAIKRRFNHELVVLAALSGSDGNMHEREWDQIVDYIERELEWDRASVQPSEILALRNHVRRIRITRERLTDSVEQLLKNKGKFRLYARQLDRFLAAARQVITADDVQHPAELEFIGFLKKPA